MIGVHRSAVLILPHFNDERFARLERFIGVIYRPDTKLVNHYAEASLPQQFNAFAITPLG